MNKKDQGYVLLENQPIYYTTDMDATLRWFETMLGWHGRIIDRDAMGVGTYGFVSNIPAEQAETQALPFLGFHLWPGVPERRTLSLAHVSDVKALREGLIARGHTELTPIQATGAGQTCEVTTPDGVVLWFFS